MGKGLRRCELTLGLGKGYGWITLYMNITLTLLRLITNECKAVLLGCFLAAVPLGAAETVLLDDPMDDLSSWTDLSHAVSWAGAPASGSTFENVGGVLQLNAAALNDAGMWGADGIRSFSAIDFPFPLSVAHATNTVTVEVRMKWDTVSAKGESNRVALMLLHDYPAAGVNTTPELKAGNFDDDWFGRPAYQVRIRGGFNATDAAPYLMYGGGLEPAGEFEKQMAGEDPLYWLPGFVSGAGGTTPGTSPDANYPASSWTMGTTAPAAETYKRYRYIVEPHAQSLWVDDDDDGAGFVKVVEMPLPLEANAPTDPEPPLYRYFEHFQALRLYFRSAGTGGGTADQVYVDSVKVTVDGDYALEPAETISLNNGNGDFHTTSEADSALTRYRFSDTIKNYPASMETTGLRYTGGAELESAARLEIVNGNASPIAGATGAGTKVRFRGVMDADGFGSYGSLVLMDNGHWVMEPEADLNFILDGSLFTRQLWVYGDGTGTLEIAEGFVADHTHDGTRGDGIASYRLSNTTLITHHTQSLPVAPRPDGSGGLQINGHLVFENAGGSSWITRTNAQTYTGAVWIGEDTTIRTETDLTHAGVTQYSSHMGTYWAANAFQTTGSDIHITKTGPADLIFAEETAFMAGSVLEVAEGGVVFLRNPADGFLKASPTTAAGAELKLEVASGARVAVDTELVEMARLDLKSGGSLVLEAQPDGTFPQINLAGNALLAGSLVLRNSGGHGLESNPADLLTAGGMLDTTALTLVNETSVDFATSVDGGTLKLQSAEPFDGREPKFFYYQSDGRFVYLGMGDSFSDGTEVPLSGWRVAGPEPAWMEEQPGGSGTWEVAYGNGEAVWNDSSGAGAHGRYHIATFAPGLDEGAFGEVSYDFVGGPSGSVPVLVIRRGVVIDEDWSDGAFDAAGWQLTSNPDGGFFSTGRTEPANGLAVRLDDFQWGVAFFHTDHFGAGPDDILVLKMTSFSDVAFNNAEFAKPEVAALHDNPDHQFGHEHAAELSRHYYTLSGANQLRPSVDNQENSLSNMHHSGGSTAATLENAETAMGIFRTVSDGTQVEVFGENRTTETLIVGKSLMEDNLIQISIPRSYEAGRGPVHRAGTDASNSLVGFSYAHVGVTSRTDANLDYATDAYDFMYLNSYYGNAGSQLTSGDLDNDGDTDAADLALLRAEFGRMHNPGGRMTALAEIPLAELPGGGSAPTVGFNANTGELVLLPDGSAVVAIVVEEGPVAAAMRSQLVWSGDWLAASMSDGLHWADASRLGVTVPVVLARYPVGTTAADFGDIHVGFAGGGTATLSVGTTSETPQQLEPLTLRESGGGTLEMRFASQPGFTYQIQQSAVLSGDWTHHGSSIAGDGSVHVIGVEEPLPGEGDFYRILIEPLP